MTRRTDPAADRVVLEHSGTRTLLVWVDAGAELVEIRGGTPLTTARRVRERIGGRVPVSLVTWPFESIDGVAAYKAAFAAKLAAQPAS